jgi:hypothetical protein
MMIVFVLQAPGTRLPLPRKVYLIRSKERQQNQIHLTEQMHLIQITATQWEFGLPLSPQFRVRIVLAVPAKT